MTPLERLNSICKGSGAISPVKQADLALALAVIEKAQLYFLHGARAEQRKKLWAALKPLTTESTNDGK